MTAFARRREPARTSAQGPQGGEAEPEGTERCAWDVASFEVERRTDQAIRSRIRDPSVLTR